LFVQVIYCDTANCVDLFGLYECVLCKCGLCSTQEFTRWMLSI